jgi:YggT family protein
MYQLVTVVRDAVFVAFCLAGGAATASWLVRTQKISPFSPLGRFLKKSSDPVLTPVETRVVRLGGLPSQAGWWLVVGTAIAGLLLIWLTRGAVGVFYDLRDAYRGGFVEVLRLLVEGAYDVLFIALIVRVAGSWIGAFRYSRWARPAYRLTDWLVEPIRKVLPPFSGFDFSPIAAWIVLLVLRMVLLSVVL